MNPIVKYAIINATATAVYIIMLVSSFFELPKFFPKLEITFSVLVPIVFLMTFVFSATLTSSLILGRPILWYLEGKKKEAILLLMYTLTIFLGIALLVFFIAYFFPSHNNFETAVESVAPVQPQNDQVSNVYLVHHFT